MNICSIVNSLTSGGAEVLVSGLSAEFARGGDASLVIALCDAQTLGNSAETERRIAGEIEDAGGTFVSLGLPASRNPLSGGLALRKILRRFNPDALHAHTVRALPMIALARIKAPVVLTHHNTKLPFSPKWFRLSDLITDSYVAIGAEVEAILGEHVGKPIVHIPNAAGRSFGAGSPREAPNGKARILSVGAISEQKNYPLLIEAAAAMKAGGRIKDMPEFRIAGGGADLEKLRAAVTSRGLDQHVQFLGERSDVPELMRASDLYLNVSLYEGMPLTLLEAMASGLPIVATDVPGNRELVENGLNGLKASLGDAETIARTIENALSDSAGYAVLSKGAIERSKDFSIESTASKHRELYRSLAVKG